MNTTYQNNVVLNVVRNRDYSIDFIVRADLTGYAAKSQIRLSPKSNSDLIAEFTVTIGTYSTFTDPNDPSITYQGTSLILSLAKAITGAIIIDNGFWDIELIDQNGLSNSIFGGIVNFIDVPTI